ncbi:MAG: hypothetical protein SVK08_01560 [Halobacteriota archaeon]|nr:hypothetical protein [Halobacteriota archaeon]
MTAKKGHKCCECLGEIKEGDKYERFFGVYDVGPEEYKTCLDCTSVRDAFFCGGRVFGAMWEDIIEHIRNCYSDGSSPKQEKINKLTPEAREKILDMVEESWEERENTG